MTSVWDVEGGSPVDKNGGSLERRGSVLKEKIDCPLLCYLCHKMDIIANDKLIKICAEFYTDEEIKVAKEIVYNKFAQAGERNIARRGPERSQQNMSDILDILHKTDPENLPLFGVYDLNRLPPLDMNSVDVTSMFMDIKHLKEMWTDNADPESIIKMKAMQKEVADMKSMMHEMSLQLSQVVNHIVKKSDSDYSYARAVSEFPSPKIAREMPSLKLDKSPVPFSVSPKLQNASSRAQISHNKAKPPRPERSQHQPWFKPAMVPLLEDKTNVTPPKSPARDVPEDEPKNSETPEGMTKVQRRRRRRKENVIVGSSVGLKGGIKSRGRYLSLFISRLDPDVEPNVVKQFISENFEIQVECTKLKTRYDSYSSFKVEGYCNDPSIFLESSKWPENILVKKFYNSKH